MAQNCNLAPLNPSYVSFEVVRALLRLRVRPGQGPGLRTFKDCWLLQILLIVINSPSLEREVRAPKSAVSWLQHDTGQGLTSEHNVTQQDILRWILKRGDEAEEERALAGDCSVRVPRCHRLMPFKMTQGSVKGPSAPRCHRPMAFK